MGVPLFCWEQITISFIVAITRGLFFFLSLYFVKQLHLDIANTGIILTFYGLGAGLGGFLGGKLADSLSFSRVCVFSLFCNAIVFFLFPHVSNVGTLAALCFLWAMFSYVFLTANHAWILDRTQFVEAERLKVLNILFATSNLGGFVAAAFVSLSDFYGFNTIFIGFGIILLLAMIFLLLRNRKYMEAVVENINEKTNSSKLLVKHEINPNTGNYKAFWFCIVCIFFVSLIITQNGAVYSIYLDRHFPALGTIGVSCIIAINPILIVFFQTPLINLFHNTNKLLIIGFGSALMGLGLMIMPFFDVIAVAIVSAILYTIGQMIFAVICELVLYQTSKPNKRAQALGMFRAAYACSMVIGPTMAGFIYHRYSGDMVWYVCGIIGLIFLVACYIMRKHYKMAPASI